MDTSLQDIRIISLALNVSGPIAVTRLINRGARAVKIEPPDGDPLAAVSPDWYQVLTKDLEIISLDLKTSIDQNKLYQLLETADLLLTSNRPDTLSHLGIDWSQLHNRFPRLCQVAIVGYAGEKASIPGHELTYQAKCGLLNPPEMPKTLIADIAGAECVVSAALALLLKRATQGEAAYCEVSLAASVEPFNKPLAYGLTTPNGKLGGKHPEYNLYRTRQGWIAVAALEPHFWKHLQQALQLDEPGYEELAHCFMKRTAEEWERWALEQDLPIAAVVAPVFRGQQEAITGLE